MADEAREYIRAAQQAELRGDKPQAIELLMKAAAVYRQGGMTGRALQMLRQASRLDSARADIAEEVRRLEWVPERPLFRAVSQDDEEERLALAALDDSNGPQLVEPEQKQLIERGPARADPALNAWCSFCCRPRTEVGDLVAGPAGAFVCVSCVRESARLLSAGIGAPGGVVRESQPPPPSAAHLAEDEASPEIEPVGQAEAAGLIDTALRLEARCVLVVGPEGCGKSTWLRELARRGLGVYVATAAGVASAPTDQPLFVDQLQLSTAEELAALARRARDGGALVLAARGSLGAPQLLIARGGDALPLYTTAALSEATAGRLPPELIAHVQAAVPFSALTTEELTEVARRLAATRPSDLDLADELLAELARVAQATGRQGHELRALIQRLPPGEWTAKAAPSAPEAPAPADAPPRRGRRRKKGETE